MKLIGTAARKCKGVAHIIILERKRKDHYGLWACTPCTWVKCSNSDSLPDMPVAFHMCTLLLRVVALPIKPRDSQRYTVHLASKMKVVAVVTSSLSFL